MNCVCIVQLICLNLCVQAGPTSNLLDESELLTGSEVLAIKNRMREVQASARATKASAVVGLAGDQSSFQKWSPALSLVELVLILIKFLFDYLFITGVGDWVRGWVKAEGDIVASTKEAEQARQQLIKERETLAEKIQKLKVTFKRMLTHL